MEKETQLTKNDIYEIFTRAKNFNYIFENPELFIRNVIIIIKGVLADELVNGIEHIIQDDTWTMEIFEDIETYENKMLKVENSVYDYIIYDSDGEKEFAKKLDESSSVKIFAKLPTKFTIETPVGGL